MVRELNPDSFQLRVSRRFAGYRTEAVPSADMVEVKEGTPLWVGPVIVLGIVGAC